MIVTNYVTSYCTCLKDPIHLHFTHKFLIHRDPIVGPPCSNYIPQASIKKNHVCCLVHIRPKGPYVQVQYSYFCAQAYLGQMSISPRLFDLCVNVSFGIAVLCYLAAKILEAFDFLDRLPEKLVDLFTFTSIDFVLMTLMFTSAALERAARVSRLFCMLVCFLVQLIQGRLPEVVP